MRSKKSISRHLYKLILVAVFFCGLELAFWGLSFFVDPRGDGLDNLVYTRRIDYQKIPHPYLGFVGRRFKPVDFSSLKDRETFFVITVLGGSVAENLCHHPDTMAIWQKEIGDPLRKKVVLNCLAAASYMQPQQVVSALLYSRDADFVLSLEGENELFENKLPQAPEFPAPRYSKLFFSDFQTEFFARNRIYLFTRLENWSLKQDGPWDGWQTLRFVKRALRGVLAQTSVLEDGQDQIATTQRLEIWRQAMADLVALEKGRRYQSLIVFQPLKASLSAQSPRQERIQAAQNLFMNLQGEGYSVLDYNLRREWIRTQLRFLDECHLDFSSEPVLAQALAEDVLKKVKSNKSPVR